MPLDLNCDLGEGESPARTRSLMRQITSASIACGGHAGDVSSMERCLRLAREHQVRAGAHPGLPGQFGRGQATLSAAALQMLLLHQIGALHRIAGAVGAPLRHVKLHGALYHATEQRPALARAYVEAVRRWFPRLTIYALAGGRVAGQAEAAGLRVWPEAFADRAYADDGRLLPRSHPSALLTDVAAVVRRIRLLRARGGWESHAGRWLPMSPRTLCVHGDTPGAARLARAVRQCLMVPGREPEPGCGCVHPAAGGLTSAQSDPAPHA